MTRDGVWFLASLYIAIVSLIIGAGIGADVVRSQQATSFSSRFGTWDGEAWRQRAVEPLQLDKWRAYGRGQPARAAHWHYGNCDLIQQYCVVS